MHDAVAGFHRQCRADEVRLRPPGDRQVLRHRPKAFGPGAKR